MTVSATLSLVTPMGVRAMKGMSFVPLLRVVPPVNARQVLAVQQGNARRSGRFGLSLDRLVDGHRLVAGQHILDAADRRVLARDRDARVARVDARALQRGDDRAGQTIIGGEDGGDVAFCGREDLLEDYQRLLVVPVRHGLIGDQFPRAVGEVRLSIR